ncbi:MAG: type I-A CRISPR-associated protein Cas5a [Thermofilaceae archaeon]
MSGVYALLVKVTLHSPILVHMPLTSLSAESFPLPPPTTLVGALAYPYFRARGSQAELLDDGASPARALLGLSGKVLYAAAAPGSAYSKFTTVERVYQHIYLREGYWADRERAYTVAVKGCTLTDQLYAFYLVTDPELVESAYGIARIGKKEGLASVEEVVFEEVSKVVLDTSVCETRFYFPKSIADDYSAGVVVRMPRLDPENFTKRTLDPLRIPCEEYVVPSPFTLKPISVVLNERGAVVAMDAAGESLRIPVPRGVLKP